MAKKFVKGDELKFTARPGFYPNADIISLLSNFCFDVFFLRQYTNSFVR